MPPVQYACEGLAASTAITVITGVLKWGLWIEEVIFDTAHAHKDRARAESSGVIPTPIGNASNGTYKMVLPYSSEVGTEPLILSIGSYPDKQFKRQNIEEDTEQNIYSHDIAKMTWQVFDEGDLYHTGIWRAQFGEDERTQCGYFAQSEESEWDFHAGEANAIWRLYVR